MGALAGCRAAQDIIVIAPPVRPTAATAPDVQTPAGWAAFARTLNDCVTDSGRVDYFRIAQPDTYQGLLDVYAVLARNGPTSRPNEYPGRSAALAYYINAHNLLAILAVAPHFGPGQVEPRRVSQLPVHLETRFVFVLDGRNVTLEIIRTECVRPLLAGDPRPLLALTGGRRAANSSRRCARSARVRAVRVTARSNPNSETGLRRRMEKTVRPPQPRI